MPKPSATKVAAKKASTSRGGRLQEKSSAMDASTVRPIYAAPTAPPRPPAKKAAAKKTAK